MTDLHMTNDASRFIGALELGSSRHIEDNMLETAGMIAALNPPTVSVFPPCRHIDDGALEAVSTRVAAGPTSGGCNFTNPMMCHHIDDDGLESAAKAAVAGPTTHLNPITRRCV